MTLLPWLHAGTVWYPWWNSWLGVRTGRSATTHPQQTDDHVALIYNYNSFQPTSRHPTRNKWSKTNVSDL